MKMDGLLRIDGRILADLLAQVNGRSIGLGQPRPTFAPLRWLQNWKRRRWLARTSRALFRVMHYEVQRDIDAMLLCFCDHGGALLRSLRADLRIYRAKLETAARQWRSAARSGFTPLVPTDVAGVRFADIERSVENTCGPVMERRNETLAEQPPSWQQWDDGRLKAALWADAEKDMRQHWEKCTEALEACSHVPDLAERIALARLSQPLLPVTCWAYDAHLQHVFQRWLVPEHAHQRWRATPLPGGQSAEPCNVPWPMVITVYRDLPLESLGS